MPPLVKQQLMPGYGRYTEHEFDKDFIEVLHEQCFNAIQNHGSATIEEVMEAIKESVS